MSYKKILLALGAVTVGLSLVACEKKEGPAEKMGKEVDKAADSVKEAAKDAADKVKEATK
jgi:hypothetical protein